MKILLLVSSDVSTYYSALLMQRGHRIVAHGGGAFENPAGLMPPIKECMDCDGCLLLSDDPQMIKIADYFTDVGKPVWRSLADVPRAKMDHARLLYVLVPLFLIVVGALVTTQIYLREVAKPVAIQDKAPVAMEEKVPVIDKAKDAGSQADESGRKRGLPPDCEKELRRTPDLLRFFANRIQAGEEIQSVVGDMRRQERRIAAVCPD